MTLGEINEKEDFVIEWSIKNFFSLSGKNDAFYCSPCFTFDDESWFLEIYPNGEILNNSRGCISLYLIRVSTGSPLKIKYSLGVKTLDDDIKMEIHIAHIFSTEENGFGSPNLIRRTELLERKDEFLSSGTLTLVCKIKCPRFTLRQLCSKLCSRTASCSHCKEVVDAKDLPVHEKKCMEKPIKCPECSDIIALKHWYEHECKTAKAIDAANCSHCKEVVNVKDLLVHEKKCMEKPIKCPECSNIIALKHWYQHECKTERAKDSCSPSTSNVVLPKNKILQDFKELFLRKENCDVVFRMKDHQEVHAHKAILSVRSSVLSSTFQHDMKEKKTGIVDVEDFDACIFSDFLCFLYCEDIESLTEKNAFSLFTAADKYDVTDLREKCMEFIKANLSVDTFCDTITLAMKHNETELLSLTTNFFIKNADKIVETVQWQSFLYENPILCNELFIKVLAYNKNSKK